VTSRAAIKELIAKKTALVRGPVNCVCKTPYFEEFGKVMVECTECTRWFHIDCLGIAEDEIEDDVDWFCLQVDCISRRALSLVQDQ